jgi:hypothetical protein
MPFEELGPAQNLLYSSITRVHTRMHNVKLQNPIDQKFSLSQKEKQELNSPVQIVKSLRYCCQAN